MFKPFCTHITFTVLVVLLLAFCFSAYGVYGKIILPFTKKPSVMIRVNSLQITDDNCKLVKNTVTLDPHDLLDMYSYKCKSNQ